MNRHLILGLRSLRLVALVFLSLISLGVSVASAQTPLASYTRAKTALAASVAATPTDSVSSLDALRRAKRAFTPLGEALGGPLSQGLQTTFDRAEQAIINTSETDLKVQAAVLSGGFQRGLYEQALAQAKDGNAAQASLFLGVLGKDLELTPAQFPDSSSSENPVQALQLAFEQRLAARSLQRLTSLRALPQNAQGARYEALAQLYSHVFLIQDSPRLPAPTQETVLGAIQALIAGEPLEPTLATLEAQLQSFQDASTAAETRLNPPLGDQASSVQLTAPEAEAEATPVAPTAQKTTIPGDQVAETEQTAAPQPEETAPAASTQAVAEPEPESAVAQTTSEQATKSAAAATPEAETEPANEIVAERAAAEQPAASTRSPASPAAAAPGTLTPGAVTPPTSPSSPAASAVPPKTAPSTVTPAPTTPDPTSPTPTTSQSNRFFGLLGDPVRSYLLIAAGLLALVGVIMLLIQAGASPALNIATVLLLLPVLTEGLIELGTVLAPLVGLPVLAQGGRYSLFVSPLMQAIWVLLSIGAGLFLLFTRRSPTENPQVVLPQPAADAAKPKSPSQPRAPLSSPGGVNWDEDF